MNQSESAVMPAGVRLVAEVNAEARASVRRGLTRSNSARSPELARLYADTRERNVRVEVYLLAEDGTVLGGAYGETDWRWFLLDVVWLDESVQGRGVGRLLMARVEQAARAAGASAVKLDTLDFQARSFYEKCGYRVYGELPNYPETHTQYLMMKELGGAKE